MGTGSGLRDLRAGLLPLGPLERILPTMRWLIFLLLVLLAALQYRLWVGEGSLAEVAALHRSNEQLRQELAQKQAANNRQLADVMDLKQGTEAIEERARQELGMIREGETFYQFVKPAPATAP